MSNVSEQISRMKAMMSYGNNSDKNHKPYSGLEYQKAGADGKMYGIVREGSKYYIKVANKSSEALKEDFDYIGGFCNRKDNEYNSYANALKHFEIKMVSLNEAYGNKEPIIESWNPDKKEELTIESTNQMKREIARQKEIMKNATMIQEKKNYSVSISENDAKCCVDKDCCDSQKNNIKGEKHSCGKASCNGGDPFTKQVDKDKKQTQKNNIKQVAEENETLAWNDNEDYMDTSNGTEIGDGKPFDENVSEEAALHNSDNQNKPKVGVGEIGDSQPFDETIEEGYCDEDDENFVDDDTNDAEANMIGDTDDIEADMDSDTDDIEADMDDDADDIESRLSNIEDVIKKIANKIGVSEYDDDNLYDDDDTDVESDDEYNFDETDDDYESDDDDDYDDESENDEYDVYESVNYRKLMKEDKLDSFGKHPAYRKKVMTTPSNNHAENDGYYDMNDDSVDNEKPYGEKIGDGKPFEIKPEDIENAIVESMKKILKKK